MTFKKWGFIYTLLLLFMFAVSSIDLYWSIKLSESLIEIEKNPFGILLMRADNDGVALFMALKFFCTCMVAAFLVSLYYYRKKIAWCVIISLSIFQLLLLSYMYSGSEIGLLDFSHSKYQYEILIPE